MTNQQPLPSRIVEREEPSPRWGWIGTGHLLMGVAGLIFVILFGAAMLSPWLWWPLWPGLSEPPVEAARRQLRQQISTYKQQIKSFESSGSDEATIKQYREWIEQFQQQLDALADTPARSLWGMDDPRVRSWVVVDVVSGVVIYLLYLATGVALLKGQLWGRRWAVLTCVVHGVRLVVSIVVAYAVIDPVIQSSISSSYLSFLRENTTNWWAHGTPPLEEEFFGHFGAWNCALSVVTLMYPAVVLAHFAHCRAQRHYRPAASRESALASSSS